jgi:hypothetical protein
MDDLSSASRTLDSLSSFCRSFSRKARQHSTVPPRVVSYAELASVTVVTEAAITHRELGIEQTEAAIDHFLELSRRCSEARRRQESAKRFQDEGGTFARSHAATEEKNGWERWIHVIESALKNAEEEIVSAVRAWEESRRPAEGDHGAVSGVIYKGHLYFTIPSGEGDARRLVIADLKASLNLDRSLAVVDLIR